MEIRSYNAVHPLWSGARGSRKAWVAGIIVLPLKPNQVQVCPGSGWRVISDMCGLRQPLR